MHSIQFPQKAGNIIVEEEDQLEDWSHVRWIRETVAGIGERIWDCCSNAIKESTQYLYENSNNIVEKISLFSNKLFNIIPGHTIIAVKNLTPLAAIIVLDATLCKFVPYTSINEIILGISCVASGIYVIKENAKYIYSQHSNSDRFIMMKKNYKKVCVINNNSSNSFFIIWHITGPCLIILGLLQIQITINSSLK